MHFNCQDIHHDDNQVTLHAGEVKKKEVNALEF